MPLKSNRKVALSPENKQRGAYERVGSLEPEPNTVVKVYLEQVGFALLRSFASRSSKTKTEAKGFCIWSRAT